MRVLGIPIVAPDAVLGRACRTSVRCPGRPEPLPPQLDRLLELGEEIVALGHRMLDLAERIDDHAEAILTLGQRLDRRTDELLDLGIDIRSVGGQIDARGSEPVDRASQVVATGGDLLRVMPTLQRAIEMTAPLTGRLRAPPGPGRDRLASEPDPGSGELS